jgi:hypothetical protein
VRLGIGISVADARRLIDVVGPARARAILLTGERLAAPRACEIGLVDEVVPGDALAARVDALVQSLLTNAPLSMAWVKQVVDFAVRHPEQPALPFDVLGTQVFATDDVDSPWRLSAKLKRIFRFIEAVLRLGVTAKAPCYDPDLVAHAVAARPPGDQSLGVHHHVEHDLPGDGGPDRVVAGLELPRHGQRHPLVRHAARGPAGQA